VLNVETRVLWSVIPCNVVSIGTTISDDIPHSEEREISFFKMLVKFIRHIRARQLAHIMVVARTAREAAAVLRVSRKTCLCSSVHFVQSASVDNESARYW